MSIQITRLEGLTPLGQRAFENHVKSIDAQIRLAAQAAGAGAATPTQLAALQAQLTVLGNALTALQKTVNALAAVAGGAAYPAVAAFAMNAPFAFPAAVYEVAPGTCDAVTGTASDTAQPLLGVATGPAPGGKCWVTLAGDVADPDWAWVPGWPVFAGGAGLLTQTPVDALWPPVVGYATAATSLCVAPQVLAVPQALNAVPATERVYIPSVYTLLAPGALALDGELRLDGELFLGVS